MERIAKDGVVCVMDRAVHPVSVGDKLMTHAGDLVTAVSAQVSRLEAEVARLERELAAVRDDPSAVPTSEQRAFGWLEAEAVPGHKWICYQSAFGHGLRLAQLGKTSTRNSEAHPTPLGAVCAAMMAGER